jgi:glycosyltransferase involved in cell wall biosynthesis
MVTKKINLVVFTREYPIGMAGTKRVQNFLDYLLRRDILITVISFRSHLPQPAVSGTHNSIPYLNIGPGIELKLSQLLRVLLYYFKGIKTILRLRKPDCVNIVYNSGGINIENVLFIFWAKLLGFKLILAIEEDYTFFKDDIKPISKFKCRTIRRFDFLNCRWAGAIIVISTFLMNKYVKLRAKNVSLIPVTAKVNFNKSKNSFNNPLQVLYAGTFADKDGVDDIIEGFLAFNNSYDKAELVLTGKSSQQLLYKEKYRDKKNLVFRGFVEDNEFYSLLRDADVLCMCRNESGFANAGFPFKLGEYLATGNPVICTKVSDVQYYLDEKDVFD